LTLLVLAAVAQEWLLLVLDLKKGLMAAGAVGVPALPPALVGSPAAAAEVALLSHRLTLQWARLVL
jgi:hypothetical protein